jgi:superfamily II DNA/RNA helicase
MCDQLERNLQRYSRCAAIHGDKDQQSRTRTLAEFKAGRCPIMIATDVAARGVDVKDVKAVINYDFPQSVEDYVHRIGRTGRAGAKGQAFTFLTSKVPHFITITTITTTIFVSISIKNKKKNFCEFEFEFEKRIFAITINIIKFNTKLPCRTRGRRRTLSQ